MKAWCEKHGRAYLIEEGCIYCEPEEELAPILDPGMLDQYLEALRFVDEEE